MRVLLLFVVAFGLFSCLSTVNATVVFNETVDAGSETNDQAIGITTWDNSQLSFFGSRAATTLATPESSGYVGASGERSVLLKDGGNAWLTIGGIDTTGYNPNGFVLSFGALETTGSADLGQLTLSYSTNDSDYISFAPEQQPTTISQGVWKLIVLAPMLPASSTLSLRFSYENSASDAGLRLDDFTLSGASSHETTASVPEPSAMLFGGMISLVVGGYCWLKRKGNNEGREEDVISGQKAVS